MASRRSGLVAACDDRWLFGFRLWPRQRELLASVEQGPRLQAWALGRRAGKTFLASIVGLWDCLLRPELGELVRPGERRHAVAVATNLRQARLFVAAARSIVERSPLLRDLVEAVTDDEILFRNGTALTAFPCTSRGARGWAISTLLLDEAAHFLDGEGNQAADPVWRSLVPSTAQFRDAARIILASTPYGTDGLFAKVYGQAAGGELADAVAHHATTAEANPTIDAAFLAAEEARDPDSFRSEYLAEFVAGGGAFLDPERIRAAVDETRFELPPGEVAEPVAALDLAFVRDQAAVAIVGRDRENRERLRLALVRAWKPQAGELGFTDLLDEVAALCRDYRVGQVYTDQYCSVPAREHLRRKGMSAREVTITAGSKTQIYATLKSLLYSGLLELYPHRVLLNELGRIEIQYTAGSASVRIRRLGGSHGDLAAAVALAVSQQREASSELRSYVPDGARFPVPTADDRARVHAAGQLAARDPYEGAWAVGSYAEQRLAEYRRRGSR